MNIEFIKSEIKRLSLIVESWSEGNAIPAVERDLALDKIKSLYDVLRFGELEGVVAEPTAAIIPPVKEDKTEDAQWLLSFQQWVQQQSIAGLAPKFGDVPAAEQLRAQKGKLKEASQAGTATYVVTLIADFTKIYGGIENV